MTEEAFRATPLDFLLLEKIPEKGIIGGVHWAGRPVRHLVQEINHEGDVRVTSPMLNSRMRSMKMRGFVVDFQSHGGGNIWARTPDGTAFLKTKEAVLRG
jgi:hypothetical protein